MKKKLSTRKKILLTITIVFVIIVTFITSQFSMIGEYMALASLGGIVKKTDSEAFVGKETRIDFGKDPQQHILIIQPPANVPTQKKAVFFSHGGGWKMGSPEQYKFVGRFFANLGYPTILAGYRLAPKNTYPIQNEDILQSFIAGRDFFCDENISIDSFILGGHSAGAQLVSLLAMDNKWLGKDNSLVSGLFTISGPLDFYYCQSGNIKKLIDGYIGQENDFSIANPILYATYDNTISVLSLHGAKDPVVNPDCSKSFVAKLNSVSTKKASLHISEKRYHSDMMKLFYEASTETKILTDWIKTIE